MPLLRRRWRQRSGNYGLIIWADSPTSAMITSRIGCGRRTRMRGCTPPQRCSGGRSWYDWHSTCGSTGKSRKIWDGQYQSSFPRETLTPGVLSWWRQCGRWHIWKLPGNYRDLIRVMVFYFFCLRSMRIIVTAISCYTLYIYTVINNIYIWEPSGNIFLKISWYIYINIDTYINWYIMVFYFHGTVCFPLIFVSYG